MDDLKVLIYIVFGIVYLLIKVLKSRAKEEDPTIEEQRQGKDWSFEQWMERLEGQYEKEDEQVKQKTRHKSKQVGETVEQVGEQFDQVGEQVEQIGEDVKQIGEDVEQIGEEAGKKFQPEKHYKPLKYERLKSRSSEELDNAKKERMKKLADKKRKKLVRPEELVGRMKSFEKYAHKKHDHQKTAEIIEDIKRDPEWAKKAIIYSEIINRKYS